MMLILKIIAQRVEMRVIKECTIEVLSPASGISSKYSININDY